MTSEPISTPGSAFVTTRWTQVLQAKGDSVQARAALSDLCAAYYTPVQNFIRYYTRRDEEAVRDLTQEFFANILAKGGLETLERGRGRFRSFLLGAVKHFIAHVREHESAAKRGGGAQPVSLDETNATGTTTQLQIPDPSASASDAYFDRQWALEVVNRAVNALAGEFAAERNTEHFNTLKPWLLGEVPTLSQAECARKLCVSEGAIKVAIHRLRKRFRELVKSEITNTLDEKAQVQEELGYLLEVLSRS